MGFEVIVVGAGPTGLMLAAELALADVRTRVVERRTEATRNSRALTLHPRSVELMDLRGIARRFLSEGPTAPGWHFANLPTPLDFSRLDSRRGYTLVLPQARTEAILETRARELGVRIDRGQQVVGLEQDAAGVSVEVRDVAGGVTEDRALFVVGCDGGRSFVRQAAGIGFPGTDETLTGMLGDFAELEPSPAALEAARAAGVLIVPAGDGLTRLVVIDPERMRRPSSEPVTMAEFRASLRRLCGSDLGIAAPRWLSRFGNATRVAERYRERRVLLAGDATHIHFPAAGQGLNTGLQDAMNLGWKLAAEVRGRAPAGLLDSYDAERRPAGRDFTENTEIQLLLGELTLTPEYARPAAALRALLDELLGLDEVNRLLAGRVSALSTSYPAAAGDDPLVGRRMPDLGLIAADRWSTHVSELLVAGRFALLDFTGGSPRLASQVAGRVEVVAVAEHDERAELRGVRELLVRPDGHVAWASRTADPVAREAERERALTGWVGLPVADPAR